MKVRKKDGENLSQQNLEKVFKLLNNKVPITKVDACKHLNIAYNTARLKKIMQQYMEERDYHIRRRKELRNTPVSDTDVSYMISTYLEGSPISEIAETLHRSVGIVKRSLQKYNIPLRNASINYMNPIDIEPSDCLEFYENGDLVYSTRYNQPAYTCKRIYDLSGIATYRIWLQKDEQYAYQPYYELANLTKLQKKFGIELQKLKFVEDIRPVINQALINAKKRKTK